MDKIISELNKSLHPVLSNIVGKYAYDMVCEKRGCSLTYLIFSNDRTYINHKLNAITDYDLDIETGDTWYCYQCKSIYIIHNDCYNLELNEIFINNRQYFNRGCESTDKRTIKKRKELLDDYDNKRSDKIREYFSKNPHPKFMQFIGANILNDMRWQYELIMRNTRRIPLYFNNSAHLRTHGNHYGNDVPIPLTGYGDFNGIFYTRCSECGDIIEHY